MAKFLISTTGTQSPVTFTDLGYRSFVHPTVSYDLLNEFSILEIGSSNSVQSAITSGFITVTDEFGTPITFSEDIHIALLSGGTNVTTGGTYNHFSLKLNDDISINDITSSGASRFSSFSASSISASTIMSGSSELSSIFLTPGSDYVQNVVTVGTAGNVDFTSIKSAVDSITANTFTNQWLVSVGPGLFIEDTITMKPYVHIRGANKLATIIEVDDPSKNAIIGSRTSSINNCRIQGATNTGLAGIFYSNPTTVANENVAFIVDGCAFGDNNILVNVSSSGSVSNVTLNNIIVGSNNYVQGFVSSGSSGTLTSIFISNSQLVSSTATTNVVLAEGSNTQVILNSTLITRVGSIAQTAAVARDGGSLRMFSVDIRNHTKGIWIQSGGTAPSISAVGVNMTLNTQDINIEHSGATGSIDGVFNRTNSLINPSSTVVLQGLDRKIIRVAKLDTDYTSVADAVNSITDASATNRYAIEVGPGIFNEDKIFLKPYISVIGIDSDSTFINANDPNDDLVIATGNCSVRNIKFGGTSGASKSCFVHTGDLVGGTFTVENCSFTNADKILTQTSTSGPAISFFSECFFDPLSHFTTGFDVSDNGSNISLNGITSFSWLANPLIATGLQDFVSADGSLTSFIASNMYVGTEIGNISGNCFHISNGATFNISSAHLHGFNRGLYVENTGSAPSVIATSIHLVNNTTDILIEHPDTTGSYQGVATMSKVSIDDDSPFNIAIQNFNDGSFNISNKLNIRYEDGTLTDVSTLINESSTMGLLSGGTLSVISGFTIGVSSGFGYLQDPVSDIVHRRLDWSATSITLSADSNNYIFFNENEILSSSGSRPDTAHNILLGRAVANPTGIEFIDHSPLDAEHLGNNISLFAREALGPVYVSGSIVTENTGSTFSLDVTQGNYFYAENQFQPTGGTSVPLTAYYRNGSGGFIRTAITSVDNVRYDDGTGTLASLSADHYTKHTIYLINGSSNEKYFMVYGQAQYSALTVVEQSDIPGPPSYFNDAVVLIASTIVQQGATGITTIQDLRPVIGFKAPGVAASSFHGNLLGLGNDDHTQYLLASGARALSGDLDLDGNNIVNVGTLNGVTVELHSSRHLPNGSDPLSSATPVSVTNVNSIGVVNAFSRSDHGHAHGDHSGGTTHSVATTSLAGFMSASDKTYFDSIPNIFNTKASLSGAVFTDGITAVTVSASTVYGGTIFSGSSNISSIFVTKGQEVRDTVLTGYSLPGSGTTSAITSGDTIIGGIQKLERLVKNFDFQLVSATATTTTTNTAFENIVGMSAMTKNLGQDGHYIIIFNTSVQCSIANRFTSVRLLIDGVVATESVSNNTTVSTSPGRYATAICITNKTIGPGKIIQVQWNTETGTSTAFERVLSVFGVPGNYIIL